MKKEILVNEYGSTFGVELMFDTHAEMREYEMDNYGDEGFPKSQDVWDQVRVKVLEMLDPEGIPAKLRQSGMTDGEIRALGFNI
jgi:hypothetical protein